jgi:hypothetical protein
MTTLEIFAGLYAICEKQGLGRVLLSEMTLPNMLDEYPDRAFVLALHSQGVHLVTFLREPTSYDLREARAILDTCADIFSPIAVYAIFDRKSIHGASCASQALDFIAPAREIIEVAS